MFMSCENYYENYLGDSCNNKCDKCFGNKEIYTVTEDFEVCGKTLLDKVVIKKSQWFWVSHMSKTHVRLDNGSGHELIITHELFSKYFVG